MQRHELNFLEFLQSFRRGELLRQADAHLTKVVTAMRETGQDGEITIKLPLKFNKAMQIEITPKISSKAPDPAMGTGIYFADDDGNLTRRDPNQLDIEDEIERRRAAE
ncbi:hypothetical protein ATO6_15475 [Oceanicola sp. 22II-s10i]|uniref:hypothetical protein n=1 Tax=Oceanicola sp. 22II-s10i TaxID=1317116 RepID=UPI000B5284B5|nr:hypothetical protein [Oceanicola sp. 22II-s10i]OWU83828.1 hypothetical protein ATO6_15475 [Oceanicola sp. 22II-s10i]